MTIAAIFRSSNTTLDKRLLTFYGDDNTSRFAILGGRASGQLSAFMRTSAGTLIQLDSGAGTYTADTDYTVMATAREGLGVLYVNGLEKAQSTTVAISTTLSWTHANPIRIGTDPLVTGYFFSGAIAGIFVWLRALSPVEALEFHRNPFALLVAPRVLMFGEEGTPPPPSGGFHHQVMQV
jgi:hypothetical protein